MKYILMQPKPQLHPFWPEQLCIVACVNKQVIMRFTESFNHMQF